VTNGSKIAPATFHQPMMMPPIVPMMIAIPSPTPNSLALTPMSDQSVPLPAR